MNSLPLPARLTADLETVDTLVQQRINTRPIVADVMRSRIGIENQQRIRAALALLAAQFGDYQLQQVQHVASTIELIAVAAQVHDTIIDSYEHYDTTIQDGPWPHGVPLMIGDYLYALASAEMSLIPDARAITAFSEAVKRLTEASLTPVTSPEPFEQAKADYLDQIEGRTATLFAAASMAGGIVGGSSDDEIQILADYGRALGMAYQIAQDDRACLPIDQGLQSPNGLKAAKRKKISLALIYAVAADPSHRLIDLFSKPELSHNESALVYHEMLKQGRAAAQRDLDAYVARAIEALGKLPRSQAANDLLEFTNKLMQG
jgi:geranylgeranyl pyrophosphate synthase